MIHIVVALPAEARPLLEHFHLQRRPDIRAFPLYENETTALVVSGIGKVAAAAATSYLHLATGAVTNAVWLNVGLAGDGVRNVGEAVLAHRVTDEATQTNWYPPLVFEPPCETAPVLTLDRPVNNYPESWTIDMEASGYYATACRFSTAELVHSLKVVSDNATSPARAVTAETASELVQGKLGVIETVVRELAGIGEQLTEVGADPAQLRRFLDRWHFSVSQRHRLRELLRRWQLVAPGHDAWSQEIETLRTAQQVLALLDRQLQARPIKLS